MVGVGLGSWVCDALAGFGIVCADRLEHWGLDLVLGRADAACAGEAWLSLSELEVLFTRSSSSISSCG
jgi:hypothetical protein